MTKQSAIDYVHGGLESRTQQDNQNWFKRLLWGQHVFCIELLTEELRKNHLVIANDKPEMVVQSLAIHFPFTPIQVQIFLTLALRESSLLSKLKGKIRNEGLAFYYQTANSTARDIVYWAIDANAKKFVKWFLMQIDFTKADLQNKFLEYVLYAAQQGRSAILKSLLKTAERWQLDTSISTLLTYCVNQKKYYYIPKLLAHFGQYQNEALSQLQPKYKEMYTDPKIDSEWIYQLVARDYKVRLSQEIQSGTVDNTISVLDALVRGGHQDALFLLWSHLLKMHDKVKSNKTKLFLLQLLCSSCSNEFVAWALHELLNNHKRLGNCEGVIKQAIMTLYRGEAGISEVNKDKCVFLWSSLSTEGKVAIVNQMMLNMRKDKSITYLMQGAVLASLYPMLDKKIKSHLRDCYYVAMELGLHYFNDEEGIRLLQQRTQKKIAAEYPLRNCLGWIFFTKTSNLHYLELDHAFLSHGKEWVLAMLAKDDLVRMQALFKKINSYRLRQVFEDPDVRHVILMSLNNNASARHAFEKLITHRVVDPGQLLIDYMALAKRYSDCLNKSLFSYLISQVFYGRTHPFARIAWLYTFFKEIYQFYDGQLKEYLVRLIWFNARNYERGVLIFFLGESFLANYQLEEYPEIKQQVIEHQSTYQSLLEDSIMIQDLLPKLHRMTLRRVCMGLYDRSANSFCFNANDPERLAEQLSRVLGHIRRMHTLNECFEKGITIEDGALHSALYQAYLIKADEIMSQDNKGVCLLLSELETLYGSYERVAERFNAFSKLKEAKSKNWKNARNFSVRKYTYDIRTNGVNEEILIRYINYFIALDDLLKQLEIICEKYPGRKEQRLETIGEIETLIDVTYNNMMQEDISYQENFDFLKMQYEKLYDRVEQHHRANGKLAFLGMFQPNSRLSAVMRPFKDTLQQVNCRSVFQLN